MLLFQVTEWLGGKVVGGRHKTAKNTGGRGEAGCHNSCRPAVGGGLTPVAGP